MVQADKGAGYHVVGQYRRQALAQAADRPAAIGQQVGDQTLVAGLVFAHHHGGGTDARQYGQLAFNFAQFNPKAPNFHLAVAAP
ncbi:hypothetical protein AADEFJLK_02699 [Methylovulum psychrotolerans]|uniref:Uncharacterized protein n=1 Tax=Methylovulum psychrotolerans TaxID=1704499 RepID=A0A2S5CKB9_9GAMM|nr:hypothetical protein AADEFJLK_02699 [Methylovulum psychrotolerans]